MSIRIGIYDFFAYTIPGGLLILLGVLVAYFSGYTQAWELLNQLTTPQIFLFVIGAYLTGYLFEPAIHYWYSWFEPRNIVASALAQVQQRNTPLTQPIDAADWAIWFAVIRRENLDVSLEIDRWMALSKMLRGASFSLLLTGAATVLGLLLNRIPLAGWPVVLLAFGLSWTAMRKARQLKKIFYLVIFENVVSRQEPFAPPAKPLQEPTGPLAKKVS